MAKNAYIGVNGVARKVKKAYIGVMSGVDRATGTTYGAVSQLGALQAAFVDGDLNAETPVVWDEAQGKYVFRSGTTTTSLASGSAWYSKIYNTLGAYEGFSVAIAEADPTVYWEYYTYGAGDDNWNKHYRGTSSVARKIKKAYIGVGGVARPCWAGGELVYYGVMSGSRNGVYAAKGTSVGNYALFGGGRTGSGWQSLQNNVVCVSGSLTETAVSSLDKAVIDHAAGSIGNYALFLGGCTGSSSYQAAVTAYSTALTKSAATALSAARGEIGAARVGGYLVCGSGIAYSYAYEYIKNVDIYNASLTRTKSNTATVCGPVAGETPSYAIFSPSDRDSVMHGEAFNASLTRTQKINLFYSYPSASASVGSYAIFMGHNSSRYFGAIDDSLTNHRTIIPTSVTNVTYYGAMGGASIGAYALFAGGYTESVVSRAFSVDASLTVQVRSSLRYARQYLAAASINGEKVLFYGGQDGSTVYDTIDVYTI